MLEKPLDEVCCTHEVVDEDLQCDQSPTCLLCYVNFDDTTPGKKPYVVISCSRFLKFGQKYAGMIPVTTMELDIKAGRKKVLAQLSEKRQHFGELVFDRLTDDHPDKKGFLQKAMEAYDALVKQLSD